MFSDKSLDKLFSTAYNIKDNDYIIIMKKIPQKEVLSLAEAIKNKIQNLDLKGTISFLAKYSTFFMVITMIFQIINLFLYFTLKGNNAFLCILSMILPSLLYFFINVNIEDEDQQKRTVKIYKATLLLSLLLLVNFIIGIMIPSHITFVNGKQKQSPIKFITGILDFALAVFIGFSLKQKDTEDFSNKLMSTDLLSKFNFQLSKEEKKEGDIVLCIDKDTNKPVILPYKDRFLHMLIIGPTGSGKTSQIILPLLNQDMANLDAGITVIEPKGDLAEVAYAMAQYYGRPALYFDPILDACPTFNPLYGQEDDVIESMCTAFKMLSPDSKQYFADMNEQLIRNALKVLKRLKKNRATLIDLSTICTNSGNEGRKMVNQFAKMPTKTEAIAKENIDVVNYFFGDYYQLDKSKTYQNTSGVRSQIAKLVSNKYLRRILNPDNGKSDIDFDSHLENGGVICICTAQGKLRDLGRFLGYFIILAFQSSVFKREGTEETRKPHYLYIDEFQEYANPGFAQMLTQGRSYRVASHLATQDRANIGMGSGREGKDFLQLVSANARNKIIFPGISAEDAKYYSAEFGDVTIKQVTQGVTKQRFNPLYFQKVSPPSDNIRTEDKVQPRFSASDIQYRPFKEITYSIVKDNSVQEPGVGKIAYIPDELNKTLKKMAEENRWLMSLNFDPNKCRDFNNHGKIYDQIDMDKIEEMYNEKKAREKMNPDDLEFNEPQEKEKTSQNNDDYVPPTPAVDSSPFSDIDPNDLKDNKKQDKKDNKDDGENIVDVDDDDLI